MPKKVAKETEDNKDVKLRGDILAIRYVPVETVSLWERNPKIHDIGGMITSIELHGFRDAPIYDQNLNEGKGGIIAGNGRATVVNMMQNRGYKAPAGVAVDDNGKWYIPIQFGLNASDLSSAEAFGIDHNNLTMMGGDVTLFDMVRIWDEAEFKALLSDISADGAVMASLDMNDVDVLLDPESWLPPGFTESRKRDNKPEERPKISLVIEVYEEPIVEDVILGINGLIEENEWDARLDYRR